MKIPKPVQADLALILATLIWGSTFTVVKQTLAQVSPLLFITLRFLVATAVTIAFMPRVLRNISGDTFRQGLTLAAFLLAGFFFQTLGLQGTTPSRSAFITSLSVVLVPILGFLLFQHRPRPQTLAGVLIAATGLGFLTLDTLQFKLSYGDALTLLCALSFALHILFIGRYSQVSDYRQLFILQLALSAGIAALATPILETPFLVWDVLFSIYLLITGVLATALGFYIQNRAQRFTTANRTALIFSLEPIFAVMFAYLLLDQAPTKKEWLGGGLVLVGILTSQMRRE